MNITINPIKFKGISQQSSKKTTSSPINKRRFFSEYHPNSRICEYADELKKIGIDSEIVDTTDAYDINPQHHLTLAITNGYSPKREDIKKLKYSEDEIFQHVSQIKGDFNTRESNLTDLGELQTISNGNAYIGKNVKSLGKLRAIYSSKNNIVIDSAKIEKLNDSSYFSGKNIIITCPMLSTLGKSTSFLGTTSISSGRLTEIIDGSIIAAKNLNELRNNHRILFSTKTPFTIKDTSLFNGDAKLNCPNLKRIAIPYSKSLSIKSHALKEALFGTIEGDLNINSNSLKKLTLTTVMGNTTLNCKSLDNLTISDALSKTLNTSKGIFDINSGFANPVQGWVGNKNGLPDGYSGYFVKVQDMRINRISAIQLESNQIAHSAQEGDFKSLASLLIGEYIPQNVPEDDKKTLAKILVNTNRALKIALDKNDENTTNLYCGIYNCLQGASKSNPEIAKRFKEFKQQYPCPKELTSATEEIVQDMSEQNFTKYFDLMDKTSYPFSLNDKKATLIDMVNNKLIETIKKQMEQGDNSLYFRLYNSCNPSLHPEQEKLYGIVYKNIIRNLKTPSGVKKAVSIILKEAREGSLKAYRLCIQDALNHPESESAYPVIVDVATNFLPNLMEKDTALFSKVKTMFELKIKTDKQNEYYYNNLYNRTVGKLCK